MDDRTVALMTEIMLDELQKYHLNLCDKYETLRGVYPNDRRVTGKACSCGIEQLISNREKLLLDKLLEQKEVFYSDDSDELRRVVAVPVSVITTLRKELDREEPTNKDEIR